MTPQGPAQKMTLATDVPLVSTWEVKLLYRFQVAPYLGAAAAIVAEDLTMARQGQGSFRNLI